MAGAISSTGKKDYTTPENLLIPVRIFFARLRALGHHAFHSDQDPTRPSDPLIDIDPCSNANAIVRAAINIQLEPVEPGLMDGLVSPNCGDGVMRVRDDGLKYKMPPNANQYINPPFGRGLKAWFDKALRDYLEANVATVLCVPDTPDTIAWIKGVLVQAEGRCQIGHRPKFGGMKAGIPKTISFLYYGPPEFYEEFVTVFQHLGRCESPRRVYEGQKEITVWKPTKKAPNPDFLDQLMPPPMIAVKESA